MSDKVIGDTYEHPCGLVLRVIGKNVPGDRYDEARTWCEVIKGAVVDDVCYDIGYRGGWCLFAVYGWKKVQ